MKKILFILLGILNTSLLFSQKNNENDTLPFTRLPNFSLHGRIAHSTSPFLIELNDQEGVKAKYKTNNKLSLGFGFNYKDIGISIGIGIPVYFKDTNNFSPTNALIIYADGQYKSFFGDLALKAYQGYTDVTENTTIKRPDIIKASLLANIRYKFNSAYNYMSAKGFSGKYYKTTFSPYVGLKVDQIIISGDSSIVTKSNLNNLIEISEATYISEFGIGFTGGGCFVYVYKDMFVNLIAGGGIIYSQENYKKFDDHYYKANDIDFVTDVKLNFGYNTYRFFAIAETRLNNQFYSSDKNLLRNFYSQFILKIGHRF